MADSASYRHRPWVSLFAIGIATGGLLLGEWRRRRHNERVLRIAGESMARIRSTAEQAWAEMEEGRVR